MTETFKLVFDQALYNADSKVSFAIKGHAWALWPETFGYMTAARALCRRCARSPGGNRPSPRRPLYHFLKRSRVFTDVSPPSLAAPDTGKRSHARLSTHTHSGDLVCVNPEGTRFVWQNATYAHADTHTHSARSHFNVCVIEIGGTV